MNKLEQNIIHLFHQGLHNKCAQLRGRATSIQHLNRKKLGALSTEKPAMSIEPLGSRRTLNVIENVLSECTMKN